MVMGIDDLINAARRAPKVVGGITDYFKDAWRVGKFGDDLPETAKQARRVARGLTPEEVARARSAAQQGLPEAIDIGENSAARVRAVQMLGDTSSGRAYLGRVAGRPYPVPEGARMGLAERRVRELARAGKELKKPSEAGKLVRAGRFAMRHPYGVGIPTAIAGGLVGMGLLSGDGTLSRPEGLTESDMQSLLGMVGQGMTPESIINEQYNKAIAAANATGVLDPQLEQYLTSRAAQYEQDVLNANNAYAQALAELSGQAASGYGGGQAQANRMASEIGADTGTAVSSLTPVSGALATAPQDAAAEVARQAGNFSARDKMLNEDLAYLSGVAQLMGVEGAGDIRRNLEDTLAREALIARANARESANILEQQRLEHLGRLNLERASSGVGSLTGAQIEQSIYQYANEWASFTPQQKAIEAQRRGLTGASESDLQRGYIESRLRQDGIVG